MNSDTNPSAQTLPGISRQRKMERGWVGMVQKSLWLIPPRGEIQPIQRTSNMLRTPAFAG